MPVFPAIANGDGDGQQEESTQPKDASRNSIDEVLSETELNSPDAPLDNSRATKPRERKSVSWRSLPNKSQLACLIIARLSEPLVQTSLQSYMFYQLKSFDGTLPDSVIAGQAGIMQASFKAGQLMTAMMWGMIADSRWAGRKTVIMVGLLGTLVSCVGFGFSTSFWQALIFRTIGGALNGNVAVMRTMISEIVREKRFQPRAFLLLPMCFNIGSIIGPILGGLLADPAHVYPELFGNFQWLIDYPYALPNLVSAIFMLWSASLVFFGLEETLDAITHKEDLGIRITRKISYTARSLLARCYKRKKIEEVDSDAEHTDAEGLLTNYDGQNDEEARTGPSRPSKRVQRYTQKLPFRRIFTTNMINTLSASAIIGIYMGAFNPLWLIFLSTSVADPEKQPRHLPFVFTGGLGMPPRDVGFAMALLGTIGIFLQIVVYPVITSKIGVIRCWRIFLYCFPVAAVCIPFLALVPSTSPPPAPKQGIIVWLAVCAVLIVQVVGRVFVGPGTAILINNCSPHPSTLATVHGLAQTVASASRTVAPIAGGWLYGLGLDHGVVGAVWWGLAAVALYGCVASNWVREGNGHEIILEGDIVEDEED